MRRIAGIATLLGAVMAGCATSGGIPMPQADVSAVNQAVEAQRAAFNARNLDALLLGIADDARVVSLPAFGTGRGAGDGQVSKVQYREDMAALMARATGRFSSMPAGPWSSPTRRTRQPRGRDSLARAAGTSSTSSRSAEIAG